MMRVCDVALLSLATVLVWGQAFARDQPAAPSPEVLVSRLYEQVIARHPLGIPYGADMQAFGPYLSKALRHRFDLHNACMADWVRHHPDPSLKPPGLYENGLFSGPNEEAEPKAFHIENGDARKDGSTHVTVRLSWVDGNQKPYFWRVAAVVIVQNGRLVVDDVLYLEHIGGDRGTHLSDALSSGCDGARWVGHGRGR